MADRMAARRPGVLGAQRQAGLRYETWPFRCSRSTSGFSIWSLWSVFVLFLTPAYGISADPKQAAAEKFLLTTLPTALGSGVRLPYTFAVARFGGRNWTWPQRCSC